MLAATSVGVGMRRETRHNRIDRIAARACRTARLLVARGCGVEIELQFLRVGQRDEDSGIATRVHHLRRQAHNLERSAPEAHTIAEIKPGRAVGDQLDNGCGRWPFPARSFPARPDGPA